MTRDDHTTDDGTAHDHRETDAHAEPEGVLTPEDLERVARQVRELDEDRVVVPTDGDDTGPGSEESSPDPRPRSETPAPDTAPGSGGTSTDGVPGSGESSPDTAPAQAERSPDRSGGDRPEPTEPAAGAAYAAEVTVRTDQGLASESFGSNDLRVVFEAFLRWYAGRIDPDAPPERVLRVLLAASDLDVAVR